MDLSYHVVELECPACQYAIEVLLKQVMAEEIVLCPGCYAEIHLVDEGGSTRKAQGALEEALSELERQLKGFGR
jgi:peptide subunit release factor 1 (eRF1)